MSIKTIKNGTLEYLVAEGISVPHCFTTRYGGVSTGTQASLNLAYGRGDSMENVEANLRILAKELGYDPEKYVLTRQIHSDIVRVVTEEDCNGFCHRDYPECDALVTNTPGVTLMVFTADCTPILFHDPVTGAVIEEGPMHGKAVGITGTGVIAALANGIKTGIINTPRIMTEDGLLHLQDGINVSSADVEEAGKAIGALRAGFLTLLDSAGLWVDDVQKAYMSGASGLYVDARKAMEIGMVTPGARRIVQFGNTSITMARQLILGEISLDDLKEFAKKLRAQHVMFATSDFFKDVYSIEYSLWCSSMPMSQYSEMMGCYGHKGIPEAVDTSTVEVTKLAVRDLPDVENLKVSIIKSGTELSGQLEACIGCMKCVKKCPEKALTIEPVGVSGYRAVIESDRCAGTACKRCEKACPKKTLNTDLLKIEQ